MNKINFFYATTDELPMTIATSNKSTVYNVTMKIVAGLILETAPNNYYIKISDIAGNDILSKQLVPIGTVINLGDNNGITTQITTTINITDIEIYQNVYFKFHLYSSDNTEIATAETRLYMIGDADVK